MKTFAVLALDQNDPFWSCEAAPLPRMDRQRRIAKADMIIQRCTDGNVVAFLGGNPHPNGHGHTEEKYGKFAYSTRYGFSVMRSDLNLQEAVPDSVLSFKVFDRIFIRGQAENIRVDDRSVSSEWSPVAGIRVYSEIIPTRTGHRRVHIVESEYACEAYDAGFAVPVEETDGCRVHILQGEGEISTIKPDPNTNLICTKTLIPVAVYHIKKGKNVLETEFCY